MNAAQTPVGGRWCGLDPWAIAGFVAWMGLMAYLRSLERELPTDWLRLGLPLLTHDTRPIDHWSEPQLAVLRHGLLVDGLNLLIYPTVLWSLLMWITRCRRRAGKCCARCFHQGARLALLAMPFDLLENLILFWMSVSSTETPAWLLRSLTVVSLLKLACAFAAFCWLLVGLPLAVWECLVPTPPAMEGLDPPGRKRGASSAGSGDVVESVL